MLTVGLTATAAAAGVQLMQSGRRRVALLRAMEQYDVWHSARGVLMRGKQEMQQQQQQQTEVVVIVLV
jgi:hypothetical protein